MSLEVDNDDCYNLPVALVLSCELTAEESLLLVVVVKSDWSLEGEDEDDSW